MPPHCQISQTSSTTQPTPRLVVLALRALVEHMCILARERVCGVIWRLGPGVEGVAASQGHWVGASYIYGAGDWSTHRWIFKDSVVKQPQGMHLSEVLGALDDAEKGKREFGVIIDLR